MSFSIRSMMTGKSLNISQLGAAVLLLALIFFLPARRKGNTGDGRVAEVREKKEKPIDFDFEKIKERGSLIALVDNSSTGYFIYRGRPMGYEYDLLDRLAKDLGVTLKIKLTANIEEAFHMLNTGAADIMAYHLTVTKERSKRVSFTDAHTQVRQVLIQRKPEDWRKLKVHEIENELIRNPLELVGKEVYSRKGSSYSARLQNLSEEIGGDIIIIEQAGQTDTEMLIKKVADGEIDYSVADEDVGMINATYYPNIDAKTPISFPQNIAWAVRKNAPVLRDTVNYWLRDIKSSPDFNVIYNRYFKYRKSQNLRAHSIYSSVNGLGISPYDDMIKKGAKQLNMDWMLLSSLVYQESKFDPSVESWAGAKGLMQLTNESIERYEVEDPFNAEQNFRGGVQFLRYLSRFWEERVPDEQERMKFILASYNVGHGHVLDAVKLARKFDKDDALWDDHVAHFIVQKMKPEYYNDPVVQYGYCRGHEPVNYVSQILNRYDQYRTAFENPLAAGDSTLVTSR